MVRFILSVITLLLAACDSSESRFEFGGMALGTPFSVQLSEEIGDRDALLIEQQIVASLQSVEEMMSTYRIDSEISRFNSSDTTDWFTVSTAFCIAVEDAISISVLTDGAFDITVGPLVNLWGFGPGDFIESPPATAHIEAQLARVGYEHLAVDCSRPAIRKELPELELDMSAFGKGYAVDRLGETLRSAGFTDFLIDIGGELRISGRNPQDRKWIVAIEAPLPDQREPFTVIHASNVAVATSGDYRNFFEHAGKIYSHTIDPRTGNPVTHSLGSVTVIDTDGARADAFATALLVLGPDAGFEFAEQQRLAALFLIRVDGEIQELATQAFTVMR